MLGWIHISFGYERVVLESLLTSVYDSAAVQIGQAVEDSLCDFPQHLLPYPATELLDLAIDTVKATARAVFHGY